MAPTNQIVKTLSASNRGKEFPVLELVRKNPEISAVISKLVAPPAQPRYNRQGQREIDTPNVQQMRELSMHTARAQEDAETTMSMLPDVELSAQILVSSILSPKDMMDTTLIFQAPEGVMNSQVNMALLEKMRAHFDKVYKIKPLLPHILRDILFRTGSYAVAVLPENSIDELINRKANVSMENLRDFIDERGEFRSLGLLGNSLTTGDAPGEKTKLQIAQESFGVYNYSTTVNQTVQAFGFNDTEKKVNSDIIALEGVTVTDNISLLKYPALQDRLRRQRVFKAINRTGILNIATESQDGAKKLTGQAMKLTDREITAASYRSAASGYSPVTVVKTQEQLKRRTIGNPLIMHLPSEAVIPVHVPGQEEKQVGFFVLLDTLGNPLTARSRKDYYGELAERMNGTTNSSMPSQLLQRVRGLTSGYDCNNREHMDYSVRVYGDMIEQDLMARLRNGVYTNGVALARNEEVYRLMLSRTLAKQQTQLLFIPIEIMTYFAFRYNADGIGKSLLDDMRILMSLRSMLMFSNVMASIRNSIGITDVKVKLDEEDGDPKKTIELVMDEYVRSLSQAFPLGVNSPVDITKWLQRASVRFSWESHPMLPDINVSVEDGARNIVKPDTELEENLRKRSIMAFGLNPETVDTAFNGEFATSVVNNNILLSKRVMQIQEQFTPLLTDHLVKVAMNSQGLIEEMRAIVSEHYDNLKLDEEEIEQIAGGSTDAKSVVIDWLLTQFFNGMAVELPKPDVTTLDNQKASLDAFTELMDAGLDAWISDKFITGNLVGEEAGQKAAEIREVIRAYFIRDFCSKNGVLPELAAITSTDEAGNAKIDFWKTNEEHIKAITKAITGFLVATEETRQDANTVIGERVEKQESSGGFGGGGSDFGGGGGGGGFDDGLGGGDDLMGGSDNPPGSDTPPGPDDAPSDDNPDGADPAAKKPGEDDGEDSSALLNQQ